MTTVETGVWRTGGRRTIELAPGIQVEGVVRDLAAEQELFPQEGEATHVYKVLSGGVRIVRLLPDGRRHIAAFYLAGDVFGLDEGERHGFSAEAIVPSQVAVMCRKAVQACAQDKPVAMGVLWRLLAAESRRERQHALMLGRLSAVERVAAFLAELAARGAGQSVELLMSRADIADHLGLTIETVSRTMTLLRRRGQIRLHGARQVEMSPRALAA